MKVGPRAVAAKPVASESDLAPRSGTSVSVEPVASVACASAPPARDFVRVRGCVSERSPFCLLSSS